MEFEKFRERKTFGLRVALIDLIEKKKTSEKYISVVKALSEKKEDMSYINLMEFLKENNDLKLTNEIIQYLFLWGNISVEDAENEIIYRLSPIGKEISPHNIKIIEHILRNHSVKDKISLNFKKKFVKLLIEYQNYVKDFSGIGLHLTRNGYVDMELIKSIISINKEKISINFWWLSENEKVLPSALDEFSNEDLDWLAISYREDLTFKFVSKYINKLCLELVILNSSDDVVNKLQSRYGEIYQKTVSNMMFKSKEVIKSEAHIKFHLHRMHSETGNAWDAVSKLFLMSDDFMIENWDYLNKELLVKYRKLSDRIKALL